MGVKKRCPICKEYKELYDFHKNPGKPYGVTTLCKACKADKYMVKKYGR